MIETTHTLRTAARWKPSIAACAALLLFVLIARLRGLDRGPFRVDEAHKLSETHFLRLLVHGDFRSEEWFANIIDRTNPPVGKYYFGAAIALSGDRLPEPPSLATRAVGGHIPKDFSAEVSAPYVRYLPATRRAALYATAAAAALLVWVAMRVSGFLAAGCAFVFFVAHDFTRAFGATVIFDGLLTLACVAIVPPILILWRREPVRHRWLAIGAAGVICGFAVALRLSGAIALCFAVGVLFADGLRRRSLRPIAAAVVIGLITVTIAVAVNPYYWAVAPNTSHVAPELRGKEVLPLRIAHRVQYQLRDLQWIVRDLDPRTQLLSLSERLRFFGLNLVGDPAGVALWLAVTAGLALPVLRRRETDDIRLIAIWAIVVAGGTALWIPVPWHRYLFVTLPPLTVLAGIGVAEMVDAAIAGHRARRAASG